jgi:hypothetical protein
MYQIYNYGQIPFAALTVGRPIAFIVTLRRGTAAPESLHRVNVQLALLVGSL